VNEHADERVVLTIPEVAETFRISKGKAYELVRTGRIPALRFGRSIRVSRDALTAFLGGEEGTR